MRNLLIGLYFLVAPLGNVAAEFRERGARIPDLPRLVLEDLGNQIPALVATAAAAAWLVSLLPALRGTKARLVSGWILTLTVAFWLVTELFS